MLLGGQNLPASAGDTRDSGSIPGLGRFPWRRKTASRSGILALENLLDRGAWWATVHGVKKSQTRLSTHIQTHRHTQNKLTVVTGRFCCVQMSALRHSYRNFPTLSDS